MAKKTKKSSKSSCGCGTRTCGGCNEKGQGLSMETIIIAVIALIVLVVLIVIYTGQSGKFTKGVTETSGATCASLSGSWLDKCLPSQVEVYGMTDATDLRTHSGQVCCKQKTESVLG